MERPLRTHYGRDRELRIGVATRDGMVEAIAPLFRGQGGRFACSGCSGTDTAMRSD